MLVLHNHRFSSYKFHLNNHRFSSYKFHLNKGSWLFGPDITAADVNLVITMQRLANLGMEKEMWSDLPKLEKYFSYAKENSPGFKDTISKGF